MRRASSVTSDGGVSESSKLSNPLLRKTYSRSASVSMTMNSQSLGSHRFLRNVQDDHAADSSCQFSLRPKSFRTVGSSMMSDVNGEFSFVSSSFTTAIQPKPRKSNDLTDLTIDKLNYSSLGLYGRDTELEQLKSTLDRLLSDGLPEQERQLILISGYSGTGKTTLANRAFKKATEKLGGSLFVRGKFDLNLRNIPYTGINSACAEICGAILQLQIHKTSLFEKLCTQLKTELGSELALLIQVIPTVAEVVNCDSPTITTENIKVGMSSSDSRNRFNFAFLRFIRIISNHFTPLIVVLDDLQWADGASLDLLDVLLTDSSESKLMVVGIYRSNEVDKTHIFYRTVEDLEAKSKDKYFEMTQVEIGNLEFDAVHKIIQDLLGIGSDDSRTLGLANICLKKTRGNAFFLLQFLSMLKEHRFLQFNFGTISWTWDNEEIESSTRASDNVVDLLKAKMTELSEDLIEILKLCGCLGYTFEVRTLNIV